MENPVRGNAGFSASVAFSDVSTAGSYWAGFVTASASDLPSLTANGLLGDNFQVEIPGVGQQVPVPGALVLYTSPGLGFPQEVKPRSLAFAQPGNSRFVQAWAGRAYLESAFALRSVDVLSYLGAFDYAQQPGIGFSAKPWVADSSDVDSDGLCSNLQRCPFQSFIGSRHRANSHNCRINTRNCHAYYFCHGLQGIFFNSGFACQ